MAPTTSAIMIMMHTPCINEHVSSCLKGEHIGNRGHWQHWGIGTLGLGVDMPTAKAESTVLDTHEFT